jgi:hypothetical protein
VDRHSPRGSGVSEGRGCRAWRIFSHRSALNRPNACRRLGGLTRPMAS